MSSQPVQPLRIQKGSTNTSPAKMNGTTSHRPLSEVSPIAVRRNSPSFPHGNKGNIFKGESSPFEAPAFSAHSASSPRLFWQGRDPTSPARSAVENRMPYEHDQSPAASKRSSLENLKKASRVKNSNMFAREQKNEYDPSQPALLDRPLAGGRPLGMQVQGNAFGGRGLQGLRTENSQVSTPEHESISNTIGVEHISAPSNAVTPLSPSKYNSSPTKSSLSKRTGLNARNKGFDPENNIWSDDDDALVERKLPEGRSLHRHAKSVTFDQAPPQVNEYEMTTPDPSSVASGSREGSYDSTEEDEYLSFERGSSLDRDESLDASLEDTDKTPVVLPEDWRFMSPTHANVELAQHEEDVFDGKYGSPAPSAQPGPMEYRPHQTSVNSVDSSGQTRPLPPLPAMQAPRIWQAGSDQSLSDTVERISSAQRSLPSPPKPASVSKSDIRRMSGGSFSLEDRLRLMMLQDQAKDKSDAEKQRERRMRRAEPKDQSPDRSDTNNFLDTESRRDTELESHGFQDSDTAPRISREAILRKLQSQQDLLSDTTHNSSISRFSPARHVLMDPDVAIPSLEDPTQVTVEEIIQERIVIKEEWSDEPDLYSIPDLYRRQTRAQPSYEDDETSQYSQQSILAHASLNYDEGTDTPRALSPYGEPQKKTQQTDRISLPAFADFGEGSSFDLGLESYMTPSPPITQEVSQGLIQTASLHSASSHAYETTLPDLAALRESIQRPKTPEDQLQPPHFSVQDDSTLDPGTPDSVIRHPIVETISLELAEPEATVGSAKDSFHIRPSSAQSDGHAIASARRQVSDSLAGSFLINEQDHTIGSENENESQQGAEPTENIAPEPMDRRVSSLVQLEIPRDQSYEDLGFGLEKEFDRVVEAQKVAFELSLSRLYHPFHGRFPSSELHASRDDSEPRSEISNSTLRDIPNLKSQCSRALPEDSRGRGHNCPTDGSHFANRSPERQRGYLMRQNTKVVVASNHVDEEPKPNPDRTEVAQTGTEVATSPRKISQPTWTAEPWNGKSRRKSIRTAGEKSPRKKPAEGPAPPLPGQASNVQDGLSSLQEDEVAEEEAEDFEDGAERGRLFVKVVGVKDLDLPLPQEERTSFALTLDNGLHCVTTAWLDLGRSAPIGQEFELVVLNELEFQLTLQMKLEEPKIESRPQSPTKLPASPTKKQGTFGRLFGSPRKRKENEMRAQQEAQTALQSPVKRAPSAYEMVQGLVAKDGSFARAYVALAEHEKQAFGRPYTVDIMCFNEWAMEEVSVGSSRSKKGVTALQRKPPYRIGKLELQLLFVPKPKGAKDEDMPKSMNSAARELREAEMRANQNQQWEGSLSQQGGDCPYWRRRLFKLAGSKLTAYHEATLQPRATINLAKASKLIDDKSALIQKEISTKGGGRRKSAFAEEEEGYMFVEEGFRIRFANGEVIDFYADSATEKDEWMKVLSEVVGKSPQSSSSGHSKGWTDMVLKREKSILASHKKEKVEMSPRKGSKETFKEQMEAKAAELKAVGKERLRQAEFERAMVMGHGPQQQHQQQQQRQLPPANGARMPQPQEKSPRHAVRPPSHSRMDNHQSQTQQTPVSPKHVPRSQGHMRTESHQPQTRPYTGTRSQANSPVKGRMSKEERHKKTKSMIDMMHL